MEKTLLQSAWLWGVTAVVIIGIPVVLWLVPPPFFTSAVIDIERGTAVSAAADRLAAEGVIYTPELVTIPLQLSDRRITAGRYQFASSTSAVAVASRLVSGEFGIDQNSIVIPEGFTNQQIAERLAAELEQDFSTEIFLELAQPYEGYLYPDTYQFHTDATEEEIIAVMRKNFSKQIAPLESQIREFKYSLSEVIKMASLVEREAADYQMRRRIAGVLWNRFAVGMPLQVDAVFLPLLGKNTYELTRDDLKTDSPYNLHINTGLPPTPIANPGRAAIRATINPVATDDFYYLSDRAGNFYFAETLDEHNRNKARFLD